MTVFAGCVLFLRQDMDVVWSMYMGEVHIGTRGGSSLEHAFFVSCMGLPLCSNRRRHEGVRQLGMMVQIYVHESLPEVCTHVV